MSFRTKKIREFAPRVVLPYRKRYQQDGKNKPAEVARAKRREPSIGPSGTRRGGARRRYTFNSISVVSSSVRPNHVLTPAVRLAM
jgi:hypothetical protein